MFILPFFLRDPLPSKIGEYAIRPFVLFLENHGRNFCQLEGNAEEWLQENGFVSEDIWHDAEYVYVRINPVKTDLRAFYSYEQLTLEKRSGTEECWRTFYVMNDEAWVSFLEEEFRTVLRRLADRTSVTPA